MTRLPFNYYLPTAPNSTSIFVLFIFGALSCFHPILGQELELIPLPHEFSLEVATLFDNREDDRALELIDSTLRVNPEAQNQNLDIFLWFDAKQALNEGDNSKAFKLLYDGLNIAKNKNDNWVSAQISLDLGLVFLYFEESTLAIEMLRHAEEYFEIEEENSRLSRARYLMGVAYKRNGEYDQSNEILKEVLEFRIAQKDSNGIAQTHNAIGLNYLNKADVESGVPHFNEAISIFSKIGKSAYLAKAYNNLGNLYQVDELWELSILNHEKSIEIKKQIGDEFGIAVSYNNLCGIYKNMRDYPRALVVGNSALDIMDGVEDDSWKEKFGIYKMMAELYGEVGDHELAYEFARKEIDLFRVARIDNEKTLIELFNKKQAVKFYTISDSLRKEQEKLLGKIEETENKNIQLSEANSNIFKISVSLGILLLTILLITFYAKYLNSKKLNKQLAVINDELYATRISKEEKEVLLQEIHHRVKNNMQIISSLIRLQSMQTEVETAHELFNETQNRITSMALVHELLYQTKNFERLEIVDYLTELVNHLFDSYQLKTDVRRSLKINSNKASIDAIIPIGLIVNEAVSNSLKHAFDDQENGEINIEFGEDTEKGYVLSISDNGQNSALKEEKPNSLGIELIESLVSQLDGDLHLDTSNGYHYTITIPKI